MNLKRIKVQKEKGIKELKVHTEKGNISPKKKGK